LNAYLVSLLVLVIFVQVVETRRREEEKVLQDHFGSSYQVYAEQVGAFLPQNILIKEDTHYG